MVEIKALLFDVFGTVVDWRSSIRDQLRKHSPADFKDSIDWDKFADDWRDAYFKFTFDNCDNTNKSDVFVNIDEQYRQSLDVLVKNYGLQQAWTSDQLDDIAKSWHFLKPWDDTVEGLTKLKSKYIIGTLSNGNVKILIDMAKYANLPWDVVFGGDMFRIYKPAPEVYLGAAKFLDMQPENILMIAAHIYDLQSAKAVGLQTAYITRSGEDIGKTVERSEVDYYVDSFVELFEQLTKEA
ncbi:HAD-like domain-containing protein [Lipomyces arxii]|uniref:HAD-like domain-containing protein n=1 Tax=Lipomyces arxii TaxID=56418 RepID=UPI0034CDBFFC